jgi:hypothetical protein
MATYKPIGDVISYIHGEMSSNATSSTVRQIRELLDYDFWDFISPMKQTAEIAEAMRIWYHKVKTGGPWDHKSHIKTTYGEWTEDAPRRKLYNYDVWSNVHYGYVGLACGFSEWILKAGAGVAQVKAGTVPDGYWERRFERIGDADAFSAFDDPKDQAAIQVGFDLWKAQRLSVTTSHILDAVRAVAGSLQTKAA